MHDLAVMCLGPTSAVTAGRIQVLVLLSPLLDGSGRGGGRHSGAALDGSRLRQTLGTWTCAPLAALCVWGGGRSGSWGWTANMGLPGSPSVAEPVICRGGWVSACAVGLVMSEELASSTHLSERSVL